MSTVSTITNDPQLYETILVHKVGPVDWVTFNRPDQLNALSHEMVAEITDYLQKVTADTSVRIIVLRGSGRSFCAGLDFNTDFSQIEIGPAQGLLSQQKFSTMIKLRHHCPQPIISLVHGPACGGGFALALGSDIRIAGESAKMNAAFIKIGLSGCELGMSYFLPRMIGLSVANELLMTGRFIYADRALRTGLVSDVVPDDQLEATAQELIDDMLKTSPIGLRLTKETMREGIAATSLDSSLAIEDRNQMLAAQGPYLKEGMAAFFEDRDPVYEDL
jgi:enoyl-CoA hydratase